MPEKDKDSAALSVLPTQLEEDFIAPLTAMRGALEILRDFQYETTIVDHRQRFLKEARGSIHNRWIVAN